MPNYTIHVINSDFESSNEVDEPDVEHARNYALRAAIGIGGEELAKGILFFGAEVSIELDGAVQNRMVVAMGASTLK